MIINFTLPYDDWKTNLIENELKLNALRYLDLYIKNNKKIERYFNENFNIKLSYNNLIKRIIENIKVMRLEKNNYALLIDKNSKINNLSLDQIFRIITYGNSEVKRDKRFLNLLLYSIYKL